MDSLVLDEIRAVAETPSTFRTGERTFSCVCPLVDDEVGALREAFATMSAAVRFLTCVRSHVLDQVGVLAVALVTVGAFVRFFSCVDTAVPDQVRTVTKAFPTIGADGGFRYLVIVRKVVSGFLPLRKDQFTITDLTMTGFHWTAFFCSTLL